jgi:uncharacterized protein (DUF1684 family)
MISGMNKYLCTILLSLLATISFGQATQPDAFKNYKHQYISDLYTIIKNDTAFIRFYPYNPKMITKATVTLLPDEKTFKLTTSSGKTKDAQKHARLNFKLNGKAYTLYTYQLLKLKEKAETANELFLPFMDLTCGKESYGGGRYIDLSITDIKEGKITIDFNKAYNPYCAFTTGYNCPVPPRENTLNLSVKAGEKYMADKFKH